MTLVVNIVGGPGAGKSTVAAGVFVELKEQGVSCELVTEYAKDLVWGKNLHTLGNQLYVFGKQYHRTWRLLGQVDVIITDSPLILNAYYGRDLGDAFLSMVLHVWNEMDNYVVMLDRVVPYTPLGRTQDEREARVIDHEIEHLLAQYVDDYRVIIGDTGAATTIAHDVIRRLEDR